MLSDVFQNHEAHGVTVATLLVASGMHYRPFLISRLVPCSALKTPIKTCQKILQFKHLAWPVLLCELNTT